MIMMHEIRSRLIGLNIT